MALPQDFDPSAWLDPLEFQGLIGCVLASPKASYRALFRADGFAKPLAELRADQHIGPLIPPDARTCAPCANPPQPQPT